MSQTGPEQPGGDRAGRSTRVALVVIATGRYDRFVPALVEGARKHVVGLAGVYVLADRPVRLPHTTWLPWGHLPWPYPTLMRYRALAAYREELADVDVLVYVDVDMRFEREVDFTDLQGLIAVRHPGFVRTAVEHFPYERRHESRASIPLGQGLQYFAGGVQGGRATAYLDACAQMCEWVQQDLDKDVVPVWHDESVWNRYCMEHPPAAVLPETYCSPEHERRGDAYIIALDKNHDELRETPFLVLLRRRSIGLRRRARRLVVAGVSPFRPSK